MSSEHVEVLRDIRNWMASVYWDSRVDALDAAIASLSAPQPPAEAQAQGGGEVELRHMVAKLAAHVRPTCGELWAEAERLLNRTAPPSAPVGVEDESVRVGNLPTMNQDGYPGLGEWWVQLWRGDEIIARVYGDGPDEVRSQAQDIADALNQQPAAVDEAMERVHLGPFRLWQADLVGGQISVERMREILTAALAGQQGGES